MSNHTTLTGNGSLLDVSTKMCYNKDMLKQKGNKMLTTKEVRAIIAQYRPDMWNVFTNKTKGDTSNVRRIKLYYKSERDSKLLGALMKAAGVRNISILTSECAYGSYESLIVKCILK